MNIFKMDDFNGVWLYITSVPKIVNYTLCCSGHQLPCIPPKNATIIGEHFYCYRNSLFSLDFCPLIIVLPIYHVTTTTFAGFIN